MIPVSGYNGKKVAVFGLARSGLAMAKSLEAGGATVMAWDDNEGAVKESQLWAVDLYTENFSGLSALALAPGVPLTHPQPHNLVKKAEGAGIPVIGDMELFAGARSLLPDHSLAAVTGTNGKSTTSALLTHILGGGGKKTALGGNIGIPVLDLEPLEAGGIYVFELSSFQLDLCQHFGADVAILLNITPDHLDRHGDMEGYVASKAHLFEMQGAGQVAVIGVDDDHGLAIAASLPQRVVPISARSVVSRGVYVDDGVLYDDMDGDNKNIGSITHCRALRGQHNWQNAAAAYTAARLFGLDSETIMRGFETFGGLDHRLQLVGEKDGVLFVNDSKASNTGAALKALEAYDNIHWIAGGRLKEDSLDLLSPGLGHVKRAYLVGEAAPVFAAFLDGKLDYQPSGTIEQAVRDAAAYAESGDAILLAPACASFDQFADFEIRGAAFVEAVRKILGGVE
jgi:UDP-N-acetylmuramoylalanine--D-glutamate ligase